MEFLALTLNRQGQPDSRRNGSNLERREDRLASSEDEHPKQGVEDGTDDLTPLLQAAQRGDDAAWRRLVELYGRRIFALAKSRCKDVDVAEEITQSVFATMAAKLGEYTEQGRFEPWLFRVAMNRVRDHVRREKRRPVVHDDQAIENHMAGPGMRPSDTTASGAMMSTLRLAMDDLADSDREVIELRHHGGLSFKQIADMLDEPLGTLLARHHRALKKLREILEGKYKVPAGELT